MVAGSKLLAVILTTGNIRLQEKSSTLEPVQMTAIAIEYEPAIFGDDHFIREILKAHPQI